MWVIGLDRKIFPTQNDLQGLPRLAWQVYNQLSSLYIQDGILCREFEPTNGRLAYLQQIVPPSLVTEKSTSLHNSLTAGHLEAYKTLEKFRQRYYWPDFKTDVKHHILRSFVAINARNDLALHKSTDIRS